jgi:hypothetical protein
VSAPSVICPVCNGLGYPMCEVCHASGYAVHDMACPACKATGELHVMRGRVSGSVKARPASFITDCGWVDHHRVCCGAKRRTWKDLQPAPSK